MGTGLGTVEETREPLTLPRHRRRTTWVVVTVVALVALLSNLLASLLQPHLHEPQAWPTPELQHKFDRIVAIAGGDRTGPGKGGTVLVGDSLLDAGADPSLLTGVPQPVFNASLAGETLPVIASWATRVVTPRLHPSLVVLGFTVNVLDGNIPGEPALVRGFQRSRTVAVAESRGGLLDRLDGWLRSHVALYRDRSVVRDPFSSSTSAGARVYDPPLSGAGWNTDFLHAYLGESPQDQAAATSRVRAGLFVNFAVSKKKMFALGALIDELRRQGARVLLVAMPVSSSALPAVGGSAGYQSAMSDLLAVSAYHGASTAVTGVWPDQDFADAVHLNAAGASRFSAWLNSRLVAASPNKP